MEKKLRKILGEFLKSESNPQEEKRSYKISEKVKQAAIHKRAVKSAYREGQKSAAQFMKAMKFLQEHSGDPYVREVEGGPLGRSYKTSLLELNTAFEGTRQEKAVPVEFGGGPPISEAWKVQIPSAPNLVQDVTDMNGKRKADDDAEGPSKEFHNHPAKNLLDHMPLPVGVPVEEAIPKAETIQAHTGPTRSQHSTSALAEHYRKKLGLK